MLIKKQESFLKEKQKISLSEMIFMFKNKQKIRIGQSCLHRSNCFQKITKLKLKNQLLFCEKTIFEELGYLKVLSKFIDEKINGSKQKFRSINNKSYIENFSKKLADSFFKYRSFFIFHKLKKFNQILRFQKKELKIFKVLYSKFLIENLCLIFDILSQYKLEKSKSKSAKNRYFSYKNNQKTKKIEVYHKFLNKNSQKIQYKIINKNQEFNVSEIRFFYECDALFNDVLAMLKILFN